MEGGLPKVRKVRIQKRTSGGAAVEAVALEPTQPASSGAFDDPTNAYARPAMLGLLTKCVNDEECVTVAVAATDDEAPVIRRRGLYRPVAPTMCPCEPPAADDHFPPEAGSSVRLAEPHDREWVRPTADDRSGEWLPDVFLESVRSPEVAPSPISPSAMPTRAEGRISEGRLAAARASDVFPVARRVASEPPAPPPSKPRLRSVLRTGSRSRNGLFGAGPVTKDWSRAAASPVVPSKTARIAVPVRVRTGVFLFGAVVARLLLAINLLAATLQTVEIVEALWAGETLASSLDR